MVYDGIGYISGNRNVYSYIMLHVHVILHHSELSGCLFPSREHGILQDMLTDLGGIIVQHLENLLRKDSETEWRNKQTKCGSKSSTKAGF